VALVRPEALDGLNAAFAYTAPQEDMGFGNGVSWGCQERGSAMRRRTWEAKTNAWIVLEGLTGKPVAELCHAHQISQAPYDQ
jgi:hypothetical protein